MTPQIEQLEVMGRRIVPPYHMEDEFKLSVRFLFSQKVLSQFWRLPVWGNFHHFLCSEHRSQLASSMLALLPSAHLFDLPPRFSC